MKCLLNHHTNSTIKPVLKTYSKSVFLLICLTAKNTLKTDLQFSDMYCLMAAHVCVDLWRENGEFFLVFFLCPNQHFLLVSSHWMSVICRSVHSRG